jgi:hypothetical protein
MHAYTEKMIMNARELLSKAGIADPDAGDKASRTDHY